MRNPCKVLGVASDSSASECKRAFRKLLMVHHPDKGGNSDKFLEILEAYKYLEGYNFSPPRTKVVYTLTHDSLFDFSVVVSDT